MRLGSTTREGLAITDANPPADDLSKILPMLARVRVADGRLGQVIGFYHWPEPTVLVRFAPGDISEFRQADVTQV